MDPAVTEGSWSNKTELEPVKLPQRAVVGASTEKVYQESSFARDPDRLSPRPPDSPRVDRSSDNALLPGRAFVPSQTFSSERTVTELSDVPPKRHWREYAFGVPRYAAYIASDVDKSTTIYRRFDRLAARNLLCLEAEMSYIETSLDSIDNRLQAERSTHADDLLADWDSLLRECNHPDGHLARQIRDLTMELREKIREYYEAMTLQSEVMEFARPDKRTLYVTQETFWNTERHKARDPMIKGPMSHHLERYNKHDLCVLTAPKEQDRLTTWLEGQLGWILGTKSADNLQRDVKHSKVSRVVSVISITLATFFLIGAIVALFFITNKHTQLILLSVFTVSFAVTLGAFTNARRQDIFAATAAYAAVLVVFLSGDFNTKGTTRGENATTGQSAVTTTVVQTMTSTVHKTITSATAASTTMAHSGSAKTHSGSSGLSGGEIAGIAVGSAVLLLSIVVAAYKVLRTSRKPKRSETGIYPGPQFTEPS